MTKVLYIPNGSYMLFYYKNHRVRDNKFTQIYEESSICASTDMRILLFDKDIISVYDFLKWFIKEGNDQNLKIEANINMSVLILISK